MKLLSALFITFLLIGSVYAEDASSANGSTATQTSGQTTGSMDPDKPSPGAAPGVDATGKTQPGESSSSFTNSVQAYWNKFIDVFTGPPSKK